MVGLKHTLIRLVYGFFRLFPIKKKQVLLFSYYGEQYSGSPKYIGKYLLTKPGVDVIWAFVQPEKHSEVTCKTVRYGHFGYYYYLATAGTVITNYRMTTDFRKRPGQIYIQTWHSSLRLKMIEKDAQDTLPPHYVEMAKKDSAQLDYLLAGSEKSREIFERAFWYQGKIANTGTPQCDILFEDRKPIQKKVFQFYHIPEGSHVALYAPTFRKGHDTSVYDLETEAVISALKARFGGEWFLLMRLHPHLVNLTGCFRYSDHVLQATDYDDVQELLAAADFLVSDYSAIMFDFAVTGRPCVLYTPDYLAYTRNDRKLYFDIKKLPFPSFEDQAEMLAHIRQFPEKEYGERLAAFMQEIGSFDDGNASARVYDLIWGKEK